MRNFCYVAASILKKKTTTTTNNIYIYVLFYAIQAPGLHTIQYWNIYEVVYSHTGEKYLKNYLHRGSCMPCGKMTCKENLEQSQNHFQGCP